MAINKHQIIRYNRLDRCFKNFGREYTFEDLLEAVNEAILEHDSTSSGVQTRTLREDIKFMRSQTGYDAPIETIKSSSGKNYYRYSDKKFSIHNSPLNDTEAQQLKNAVSILQRFEGSPQFEWVNQLGPLLNDKFGLKNQEQTVMSLESNIDYKGYNYISPLFNAIINKTVLKIMYEPFSKESYKITFHPYFLKQYNNRWFVFGYNEFNQNQHWNLALDRIKGEIEKTILKYRKDTTDWSDFFSDIIGVSKDPDKQIEEVKLLFNPEQAPYIKTKPLHETQKINILEDNSLEVRIKIIINYELEMRILSFGEKVKVLAPDSLVNQIKERILKQLNNY
jgi:predicted DNA-binding transcriptional regulator YafY